MLVKHIQIGLQSFLMWEKHPTFKLNWRSSMQYGHQFSYWDMSDGQLCLGSDWLHRVTLINGGKIRQGGGVQFPSSFRAVSERFSEHSKRLLHIFWIWWVVLPQMMSNSKDGSRCSRPTSAGRRRNRSGTHGRSCIPIARCPGGRRNYWPWSSEIKDDGMRWFRPVGRRASSFRYRRRRRLATRRRRRLATRRRRRRNNIDAALESAIDSLK